MLARLDPALDGPVILFQDVVKVLHRTMFTVSRKTREEYGPEARAHISNMVAHLDIGLIIGATGSWRMAGNGSVNRYWEATEVFGPMWLARGLGLYSWVSNLEGMKLQF